MELSLENLKKEFEENPLEVITYVATIASLIVPVGLMLTGWRNSRTWRKEVERRAKMPKK